MDEDEDGYNNKLKNAREGGGDGSEDEKSKAARKGGRGSKRRGKWSSVDGKWSNQDD